MRYIAVALTTLLLFCSSAYAEISGLGVERIEVYESKSDIPYIGSGGGSIPSGVPLVVLRTSNRTYSGWKFVAYGDSINQMLSLWQLAKAQGKTVSCVSVDRGNYWVQCRGTGID